MANSLINSDGRLNVENYNEKVRMQREAFNEIDRAMASLEKLPAYTDYAMNALYGDYFRFSYNPLGFLFNIIRVLGVSEDELKEWITEILVYTLPTVEIGVKAALLANLKALISCNADPRIPLKLRKKVNPNVYTNILTGFNEDRGIDINIDAIDPNGILDMSPFTKPGENYYFGIPDEEETTITTTSTRIDGQSSTQTTETISYDNFNERVTSQVRADDFNAFLWYVIHKGNKQNPAPITINGDTVTIDGDTENTYKISQSSKSRTLHGEFIIEPNGEDRIIAGNTFYDVECPTNIAICIKASYEDKKRTLIPVSSDWFSCNWYVDKTNYYKSNLGIYDDMYDYGKPTPREYSREKGICNLQFWKEYDWRGHEKMGLPNNLRFTILPKPYILLPSVSVDREAESLSDSVKVQWRPIRLLFDADGNPDQKGKFSLISETYDLQPTLSPGRNDGDNIIYDVSGIDGNGVHQRATQLIVDTKTGRYEIDKTGEFEETYKSALVECYPGITVYEFNYDYIMGMKLFDAKVVCQRLFDNSVNPNFNADFVITREKDRTKYPYYGAKQRVLEIVRSILEEDEDEEKLGDCFYTFSNERYDEMLKETEEMKYRQMPLNQGYNKSFSADFTEVYKILESFDGNGSLEDQKNATTKIDFLTSLLQNLIAAIVDSVLSPKVLMLLIINRALMEPEDDKPFDADDLVRILKNIVKSLVKEIRDLIMKKLLDYILKYLTPLALELQAKIQSEQFAAYMAIIKLLLAWFNKGVEVVSRLSSILSSILSKFRYRSGSDMDMTEIDLPSVLDNFTYADIYPSDAKDKEPLKNNC